MEREGVGNLIRCPKGVFSEEGGSPHVSEKRVSLLEESQHLDTKTWTPRLVL